MAERKSWFPLYKPLVERSAGQPSSEHGTGTVNGIRDKSGGLAPQKPSTACYKRRILFLRLEMHPWVWRKKAKSLEELRNQRKVQRVFVYLSIRVFIYLLQLELRRECLCLCSWASSLSQLCFSLSILVIMWFLSCTAEEEIMVLWRCFWGNISSGNTRKLLIPDGHSPALLEAVPWSPPATVLSWMLGIRAVQQMGKICPNFLTSLFLFLFKCMEVGFPASNRLLGKFIFGFARVPLCFHPEKPSLLLWSWFDVMEYVLSWT